MATIKIGVFGSCRGGNYIDLMKKEPSIDIVAICDKKVDKQKPHDDFPGVGFFNDFDEFLEGGKKLGMNAVFLANYFNQHTPFAIKAMEAGMDVVSECTSASTMKECVELVEAVERTGRKYMLAENYPFMTFNMKMEQMIQSGMLGSLLYAEGEYNHSGSPEELRGLTPGKYHWRAWMPRTYYVTHSLGPVMYMTKTMPKYVSARAAFSDLLYEIKDWRKNYDGAAMMFCEMDNGMMVRVTGCTAMASDYSRYRVCGDRAGVEGGGYVGDDKVRLYYNHHTAPEGEATVQMVDASLDSLGEKGLEAKKAGHGGGDYWIVQNIVEYFQNGVEPFFDVYKGVAMSATAILGWRSCLNHGENFKIPDFSKKEERDQWRNDDATPFPDENGEGATLPPALPLR